MDFDEIVKRCKWRKVRESGAAGHEIERDDARLRILKRSQEVSVDPNPYENSRPFFFSVCGQLSFSLRVCVYVR